MEKVVKADYLQSAFKGKRVFVTGHTGFKGAWLIQILEWLGATVKGYALPAEKDNDLFNQIGGDKLCYASVNGDIRDLHLLQGELVRFQPHIVFHFAAQSLVRRSYNDPVDTFMVNTQGTAHVLEALRSMQGACVALMITTDKVYENPERGLPFNEDDKLGGYDPYSASKAAAEIVIESYRRSFFHPEKFAEHEKSIAAVRAGNVIGGGDYSDDRIIPDIVRALEFGETVGLRNPASVRPWQHVLEPLGAYMLLAAKMMEDPITYSTSFNFGPDADDLLTVEGLTNIFLERYGSNVGYKDVSNGNAVHEAKLLLLNSTKAHSMLGWKPQMNAAASITLTADWYADHTRTAAEKCLSQIIQYFGNLS
jgi:CDP-glucose 4,6-dehydratase